MVRKSFKHLASFVIVPIVRWYLRKERLFVHRGIKVKVKPGVFHPGLFSSTKFVIQFLELQNLTDQSLLELGCGSGLISIVAAKQGAKVTASDLSQNAITSTSQNAKDNGVTINTIVSDLFQNIPATTFDWIIINPPYYARTPQQESDFAWYCGENFEYFIKLFRSIETYLNSTSKVIMVLTKGCDLSSIMKIASEQGFEFKLIAEKKVLFDEKDFLFQIEPVN